MTTSTQPSVIEYLQRCLFLSVLAVACHLFLPIPLIGEVTLSLGSVFVLSSLVLLPVRFVIVVFVSSFLSLYWMQTSWLFLLAHTLEVITIAILLRRNVFIMLASMSYWIIIGMPLLAILALYGPMYLQEASVLLAIQSGLNGILCAAIAASLLSVIPMRYKQPAFTKKEKHLSANIFSICASVLVVPILIVSFIFIAVSSKENEILLVDKIKSNTSYIGELTDAFLEEHKIIVEQHASLLSDGTPDENVQNLLLKSQENYPAFFNLTTTDVTGKLVFFAPLKYKAQIDRLPDELKTVADRNYFIEARNSKQTFVSNALLSRGVIVAPMISIASPIIKDDKFAGIVFGAINLDVIKLFRNKIERLLNNDLVVITDASNRIVYASAPVEAKPLAEFLPIPSYNYIISELPVLSHNERQYAYFKRQSAFDWHVYVLTESSTFTANIRDNFVIAGLSLLFVVAVFLLFAYRLSQQVSAPLRALLSSSDNAWDSMSLYTNTQEFSEVANKLKRSQFLMQNFEDRLKQQVNEKTEQLEQLNLQLAAQAREDGMTHLLNRSGFDEMAINAIKTSYRLGQSFSMALLDIDHFKQINDTHGHLFGDKCLQAFSALMQRNCKRETDIIGRYGGEEFIIFMAGKDVKAHHQLMQNIHQQTRKIRLTPADSDVAVSFTVSVGICSVIGNVNMSMHDIVKLADEELYKCKRSGRDRISLMTVGYSD
ncbi:diguanylate cyclase [Glaciecola siphonariae]|uniref:diguanylate cyclase n=1 Tax=Glaciecola siphonariae TaxID=521012 RepID=A0ABV9LZR6_9ALTE